MRDLVALPRLVSWPKFLMIVQAEGNAWVGVGPSGDATRIENYEAWRFLATIGAANLQPPISALPSNLFPGNARWWAVHVPSDLDKVLPKLQRLIASDERTLFILQDGQPVVGALPVALPPGRAILAQLGKDPLVLFPADRPGAYEFQGATLCDETPVAGMLMSSPQGISRLASLLQPDPTIPPVVLQ